MRECSRLNLVNVMVIAAVLSLLLKFYAVDLVCCEKCRLMVSVVDMAGG